MRTTMSLLSSNTAPVKKKINIFDSDSDEGNEVALTQNNKL